MSDLVTHYPHLRDRIRLGSISIPHDEYPFAAFCLGYLAASTSLPIELLFEFMEAINDLVKTRILSQPNVKQMLKLLLDFPAEADKILKVLKSLQNGAALDLINFIESYYHDRPSAVDREEAGPPPSELNNDGTMELEDVFEENVDVEGGEDEKRRKREEEDVEFARRIQQEFDEEKPAMGEEEPPCEICYVNLFEGVVETLECGHIFHKNCLAETFRLSIANKTFPLRCPGEECQA
jgi:hypothetical protein